MNAEKDHPDASVSPDPPASSRTGHAWQPLTFKGCADFAGSSWSRLFFVQFIFSQVGAAVILWILIQTWAPVLEESFPNLPETGRFSGGRLTWTGEPIQVLAENRWLGLRLGMEQSQALSDV